MSKTATTVGAPQTLVAAMIEALGPTIATARAKETDRASAALAVLLDHWRTKLAAASPAAVAPAQLVIALTAIFALCDVRIVGTGQQPGIRIGGPASATFDAALRLVYVYDRICGSAVGEETMAALLTGFMAPAPDATPREERLH